LYNLQPRKRICKTFVTDWKLATIDISIISTAGFVLNYQNPEAVLFSIIFKEIDCEIQNQEATDQELVVQKLLAEHQNLVDIFS
jgi:hypothetical protein